MNNLTKILKTAALLVLVMVFAGCAANSQRKLQAQANYKIGMSQFLSGNYKDAYVKFYEALKDDPKNKEVNNALGMVHLNLKEYNESESFFIKATVIDPDFSEAFNNLCYLYYTMEKFNLAINACNSALKNQTYTTPEKSYYNLGRTYYKMGAYSSSVDAFDKAIRRYPNFFQAYYGIALAHDAAGAYDKASKAMGYAIGFDPRFQGDVKKAEKTFKMDKKNSDNPKEIQKFIDILHY